MTNITEPPSSDFFRDMIEQLTAAIYATAPDGTLIYYNEAAARFWGHRPELGVAKWCGSWKLYSSDGCPMAHDRCPMAVCLQEGRPIRGVEAIAERPDGIRVPFIPFPSPIFDMAGRLTGGVNLLVDISERKRDELSARRLVAIVEGSDDAIVSKDLNGIVTSWNRGAENIFGYTRDEMIGESITRIIPPDRLDEERSILDRLMRREKIDHYETVRRHKDGRLIDISLTLSPLIDDNDRLVGASKIARDITMQRRFHEQRELLLREMRHRIKNVIATINALAGQTLLSTADEERRAFGARLDALAHATTLSARSWTAPAIATLVRDVLAPFAGAYEGRLSIEGSDLLGVGFTDSLSLSLALHELATNSVKHGAWSTSSGTVGVAWAETSDEAIRLSWREAGGPRTSTARADGFGTRLLEHLAAHEDGVVQYQCDTDGVRFAMLLRKTDSAANEPQALAVSAS